MDVDFTVSIVEGKKERKTDYRMSRSAHSVIGSEVASASHRFGGHDFPIDSLSAILGCKCYTVLNYTFKAMDT